MAGRLSLPDRLRAAPRADLAAAAVLAAVAAVVLRDAAGYPPSVVPGVPGPAAFPRLIAFVMLLLAGALAVQALRAAAGGDAAAEAAPPSAGPTPTSTHPAPAPSRAGLRRNLAALALLVGFLLIAERTDFFVAMALLVGGLMAVPGERGPRTAGVSLLFVLFLWAVFYRLFGVQFPTRL